MKPKAKPFELRRTIRVQIRDACREWSRMVSWAMVMYIVAQFFCWTVHDALQEWQFKQVIDNLQRTRLTARLVTLPLAHSFA